MSALSLPRLISDGMILQHGKLIHVWGWDTPGKKVSVSFLGTTYTMFTNEEGTFSGYMDPAQPGGPYVLTVSDEDGNEFVYMGTVELGEPQDTVCVRATVKKHEEYNGIKQTYINRPKVV